LPIEPERVCSVKDGDVIELSKEQKLSIIYAPGHAHHQICIYESRNKGLFTGDAVGIYSPEEEILVPTTPPPDFDLNISIDTIKRLMSLPAEMLLFSHFGVTRKVAETLELAIKELETWGDVIWKAMKGGDFENAVNELKAQASKKLESIPEKKSLYDPIITYFIPLSAAGYVNYYKKMGGK
jgi:glyoxylase-like metal-dependent hydrolase (beta-lactamase superfamily II)